MPVTNVYLYKSGLVSCMDDYGRQLPSLQGMFSEVAGSIAALTNCSWHIMDGSEFIELTKSEWFVAAQSMAPSEIGIKKVDDSFVFDYLI